jgi:energy-coupling factor transporter ATP-binding protein EcfA2
MSGIVAAHGPFDQAEGLRMLDRLVHRGPDGEGHVEVGGSWLGHRRLDIVVPVDGEHQWDVRRKVSVVFQDPDDQLFMPTVYDDVAFGPRNLGCDARETELRARSALAAVGMEEYARRPPHHLSFGQRRRVAVATVLAMQPQILVLDEPTSNLDPASRRELIEVLRTLALEDEPRPDGITRILPVTDSPR